MSASRTYCMVPGSITQWERCSTHAMVKAIYLAVHLWGWFPKEDIFVFSFVSGAQRPFYEHEYGVDSWKDDSIIQTKMMTFCYFVFSQNREKIKRLARFYCVFVYWYSYSTYKIFHIKITLNQSIIRSIKTKLRISPIQCCYCWLSIIRYGFGDQVAIRVIFLAHSQLPSLPHCSVPTSHQTAGGDQVLVLCYFIPGFILIRRRGRGKRRWRKWRLCLSHFIVIIFTLLIFRIFRFPYLWVSFRTFWSD